MYKIGQKVKATMCGITLGKGEIIAVEGNLYRVATAEGSYPLYENEITPAD